MSIVVFFNQCAAVGLIQGTAATLPWRAWRTGALSKRSILSVSTNLDWGDVAAGQLYDSERRRCLALHRVSSGGAGWLGERLVVHHFLNPGLTVGWRPEIMIGHDCIRDTVGLRVCSIPAPQKQAEPESPSHPQPW